MVVIKLTKSLEQHGGYNKKLGDHWMLAARLRNSEAKLEKKRRYVLLRKDQRHERINPVFAQTFCQQLHRLADEVRTFEESIELEPHEVDGLLKAFEFVEATSLLTKRLYLH